MTDQQQTGPWEVRGDSGHNGAPFWKLMRRNPAWKGYSFGWETALTPLGKVKRFYDLGKAEAEAAKRNAGVEGKKNG